MRTFASRLACLSLIGLIPASAHALSVFRCTRSDGAITFQDQPCPARSAVDASSDCPMSSLDRRQDAPAPCSRSESTPETSRVRGMSRAPRSPPRGFVGRRLHTRRWQPIPQRQRRGERRAVPLAMLGVPSQSLADAYAGRERHRCLRAGAARAAPADTSRRRRRSVCIPGVEDPCQRLVGAPTVRLDDARRRCRTAFAPGLQRSARRDSPRTRDAALKRRRPASADYGQRDPVQDDSANVCGRRMPTFEIEQELLGRQAAAVSGQRAVGADHAMAGHDDRQRIGPVGQADRATGVRIADATRQFRVADRDCRRECRSSASQTRC